MKNIIGLLILLCLSACRHDTSAFDARIEYWNKSLSQVSVGSSTEQITNWAKLHKVDLTFLPEQQQFYANVERVPVNGIPFPCGAWNIILVIYVDQSGNAKKTEVRQVGSCV
jgi:hypothetical protein